ncbi:terpenoid synthase [Coniophora puteana RWD-64-598 SS2]|uniref:Terpene synthase n=1 Tax=Coniophora puteana (strain RWD-64-598) TaxID=741705 RepID=A0A5M3N0E8_CONPW|nr:terpenoid synthase [Coniophora puteana RWD-64-598 SS2]EIW84717.1 terpenoid synthase [Coniophora puteana RWD-64-598 SS2]
MVANAETYILPNTLDSWPWKRPINPYYAKVKAEATAWMHALQPFKNPKSQAAFDKGEFCDDLRTGCELMFFFFIIDEYTDVEDGKVTREMIGIVRDALEHPCDPRPEGEVVLGEMTRQFWERASQLATPSAQHHFMFQIQRYLQAVVDQADDRDAGRCRSVKDYLTVRRPGCGVDANQLPYEAALDIPDDVYFHAQIEELRLHATDMSLIDNDMFSYNREQSTGDENHNLITVIMHERGCSLNEAFQIAAGLHMDAQRAFQEKMKSLPSWGPEIDRAVGEYVEGMAVWTRGHNQWSYECGRYFGSRGLEIQQTEVVPLLPKVNKSGRPKGDQVVVDDIPL